MAGNSKDSRIPPAIEAIVHGVYDSGALYDPHRWWPTSYLPYSPLFASNFHGQWVEQWRKISRSPQRSFARSTAMWVLLAMASRSLKTMFDVEERCKLFTDVLDDIQTTKAGDIFCRDGSHHVLPPAEAQALVDRLSFASGGDTSSDRAYAILNATLLAYSEAVFFSANCSVRDVHGPYPVVYHGQACQLLVRDYYWLRDTELEPETEVLDIDSVRAYSLYDNSVGFSFSVLNDYTSDQPLRGSLVANAAEFTSAGEATLASVDQVRQFNSVLSTIVAAVSARIRRLAQPAQALEVIRRTYYRSSPIARAVGERWEPSPAFAAELELRLTSFEGALPPPMTREAFAVMVDPRL